jgi:hypothetical protein
LGLPVVVVNVVQLVMPDGDWSICQVGNLLVGLHDVATHALPVSNGLNDIRHACPAIAVTVFLLDAPMLLLPLGGTKAVRLTTKSNLDLLHHDIE